MPTDPIDNHPDPGHRSPHECPTTITQNHRDQQRAFQCAAEEIAGGASSCTSDPASFGVEVGNLESWAHVKGTLIPADTLDSLPLVSNSTSEHEVFYRFWDDRAVKRTWPGVYGQIPVPANGGLDRCNATPSEYLRRMALHIEVFFSDLRLEGVTMSDKPSIIIGQPSGQPSIVISQRWYQREGITISLQPLKTTVFSHSTPRSKVSVRDKAPLSSSVLNDKPRD